MRVVTLVLLAGCSDAKTLMTGDEAMIAADDYMDTGYADGDEAPSAAQVSHWMLSGSLQIESGAVVADLSTLSVSVVGSDDSELCSDRVSIAQADVIEDVPEPELEGWWQITVSDPVEDSCLSGFNVFGEPGSFFLGVGPLHPEIRAILSADPELLDVSTETVQSIFAAFDDDGPVWVFGVAGTAADFSGDIEASVPGTLNDGVWGFQGLYGFPFAD